MKLIKDFKNELMNRREVKLIIEADSNPSFESASKIISEKFNNANEQLVIKKIGGKFGRESFLIEAYIYNSVKDKLNIEPKIKVKAKKEEGAK